MGVVFKARHRPTGQVVALKILPPSFARDATLVQRFRREVAAAARLDHPNIVQILDASQDRGVHFLAMEFIEGRDLRWIVNSDGPLPIDQAIECTIQAARGLEAAHEKGIVHRDIKPANLMLDTSGVVRVLDLGLARLIEASGIFGPSETESPDAIGLVHGHRRLQRPRAGRRRQDGRSSGRHLQPGLHALLPRGGPPAVRGRLADQEAHGPSESTRSEPSLRPLRRPRIARGRLPGDDGQESRGTSTIHGRGDLVARGRPRIGRRQAEAQEGIDHLRRWKADAPRPEGAGAKRRPGEPRPPSPGRWPAVRPRSRGLRARIRGSLPRRHPPRRNDRADRPGRLSGPERSRVSSGLQGLGACAVLAVLGSILAWAIQYPRAPTPYRADDRHDEPTPRARTEVEGGRGTERRRRSRRDPPSRPREASLGEAEEIDEARRVAGIRAGLQRQGPGRMGRDDRGI